MFSPKISWNDYFIGTPATTLNSGQYSSRQAPSGSSVYVSNCLFNRCTLTSGNGGALYCTSVTYLFIESSSFFSCKTSSGQGGAIYLSSSNCLQSVLHEVCGNDCSSTSRGPFAFLLIKNADTNMNCVNYSSITRCLNDTSNSYGILYIHEGGKVFCPSVNISMNKCYRQSGIIYYPFVNSNLVTSLLSYSTFADNIASHTNCIWCSSGGAKYEIKCCNILRNKDVSGSDGVIFARGNLVIEDCCILENIATYIFYQESTSYTITLSNCTVDSTTNNQKLIIQGTVTKSFILALNHMSTHNCYAHYDSAGTLTAIPYVSHSTKKTFCYFHTCKNQARISDFFTFHCMFIFTFIHSNPSGDFLYECNSFCV
jgi:hypothetical protein